MGKSGGSSSTTTVDPVYNAGLLEISKEQQGWANQMFNMFKYGVTYDPTEKVTGYYDSSGKFVEGKPTSTVSEPKKIDMSGAPPKYIGEGEWKEKNPAYDDYINKQKEAQTTQQKVDPKYVTLTRGELQGYNASGQTSEMQYLQNLVNANQSLLGLQTGLNKAQLESQTRLLPQQEKLTAVQIQEAMAQSGLNSAQIASALRLLPQQEKLSIAQIQEAMAQTGLNQAQIAAALKILPSQTGLTMEQIAAQRKILPGQTGLTMEQIAAQRRLLPQQTAAQESRLGLYNTTMKDINKGINVGQRMDQAQAAVQHAFKNTNQTNRMDIASYGLDPSSGRYASQNRAAALAESAGIAGARTTAKNYAETEDFERKKAGLNFQI